MTAPRLDSLPGFRRRFEVEVAPGRVRSVVEDDYHHMAVTLEHDGTVATKVTPEMIRVPWTTCPGAPAVLTGTFTGAPLAEFPKRGGKLLNCTHLYDLALLAAAHAGDDAPLAYDILVSDAIDGEIRAELRHDGVTVLAWTLRDGKFADPAPIAGLSLGELGPWIATLDSAAQEHARLLRWGTILAPGRVHTEYTRSDKARLPLGQCFTFQPENAPNARYIPGTVRDFSGGTDGPLAKHKARGADPAGTDRIPSSERAA